MDSIISGIILLASQLNYRNSVLGGAVVLGPAFTSKQQLSYFEKFIKSFSAMTLGVSKFLDGNLIEF